MTDARAKRSRSRRFWCGVVAAACGCTAALWAATARADDRAVIAPETPVRSAPFDVAPEIARLRAGDRVHGDDQAQGDWRRVALPDGRSGFVRDADTEHSTIAVAAPAVTVAAAGGGGPADAAAATGGAVVPSGHPAPVVVERPPAPAGPEAGPHLLGVALELMPFGTLSATDQNDRSASSDAVFAMAVAPFLDAAISPNFSIGFSPQMIFRVKGDGDTAESAKQFDFRLRLIGRMPLSERARAFTRLSPAYSVITFPDPPGGSNLVAQPTAKGFLLDFAVGLEIAVLRNLFVVTDLGYQAGFQSNDIGDRHTSYLHVGAGFAVGL